MENLFSFVQFEFTYALGPGAGRYVVQSSGTVEGNAEENVTRKNALAGATMSSGATDVLAITVAEVPSRRRGIRRKEKTVGPDDDKDMVPLLLATFIRGSNPHASERAAQSALRGILESEELQSAIIEEGFEVLNRAIRAYRVSARDPYIMEVARRNSRRVRMGYGTRDEVTTGRWTAGVDIPSVGGVKQDRAERLAPTEITAKSLAGTGIVLEGEDLMLRVYLDLDHGRIRGAASQLKAAIDLLWLEFDELGETEISRVDFAAMAEAAEEIVVRSRADVMPHNIVEELEEVLGRVERGVERWRFAGVQV